MAAKKKTKTQDVDDLDLDLGDMEDMDLDINFEEDGLDTPDRTPSRSEVTKELAEQAASGFADSMVRRTAEKALPSEYSSNYSEVVDLGSFGAEVIDRNKQKLEKSLFRLGKEVKKILPMQIGLLDKYLEKKEDEFAEFRQQSEEEMRNSSIASELSTIFDKQLDIQKAIEAKRSAEEQVGSKERLVTTKLTLDVLRNIDANAATSTAFETQISKEFFRKSLEIQYKSFFVQADMLRTMRDHYKAFAIQFTNIEKNTSLPEFVKLKNTERLADIMRTNATQAVYKQMFDRSRYLETVKKRVGKAVDDKVTSVTDSMGDITDALSMMNDGGPSSGLRTLGGIGAGMGGDALGEMAGDWAGPKIKDRIKDNKYINTGANYLKAFAESPATLLRSLRDKAAAKQREAEGTGSWSASLYGFAKAGLDLTGEEKPNITVKKDNYLDHNQPAIFDNKAHRSITEVIPLFLSRILKQNTDLTLMYHQVNSKKVRKADSDILMYDYRGRNLDTSENIKAKLQDDVFTRRSNKSRTKVIASQALSRSKANISRNETLSKEEKKKLSSTLNANNTQDLLADYYAKASNIEGVTMDHDTLINKASENPDLAKLISENEQLAKVIGVLKDNSGTDHTYIDKSFADVQNTYPIEALKTLFSDASKLTRAKQPNLVTDKNALIISKALSRFILNRAEDITAENITSRLAFSYFLPHEFNEQITQNLTVLIEDVKHINANGDLHIQSSLIALLAITNQSLKSNFEIDPNVYTNLRELYPDFFKSKTWSVENLAEGKLDGGSTEGYVPFSDVKDATKASGREMVNLRENVFATSGLERMLTQVKNKSEEFKAGLRATSGSPTAMAEFLLGQAKDFKSTVSSKLTETSAELQKGFGKLGKHVDELVKNGSAKALGAMVTELNAMDKKLESYIILTQSDLTQRTEELQRARDSITDITTQTTLQRAANRELEMFVKMGQRNLSALVKLREVVQRNTTALSQLAQSDAPSPTDLLKRAGSTIKDILEQAKKQLAELEALGAANRTPPAAA